ATGVAGPLLEAETSVASLGSVGQTGLQLEVSGLRRHPVHDICGMPEPDARSLLLHGGADSRHSRLWASRPQLAIMAPLARVSLARGGMKSVPRGYGTHADFLDMVRESATKRAAAIQAELREAFARYVREEPVSVIQLADITVFDLSEILKHHPL